MIDPHSLTWKTVLKFIESERQDCLDFLIADRDSERQRGALIILDKLERLAADENQPDITAPLKSV
tara:strand:- start:38 stop:235 length:198 start_codon:yes stop_codon:yes gene_type:complete